MALEVHNPAKIKMGNFMPGWSGLRGKLLELAAVSMAAVEGALGHNNVYLWTSQSKS